MHEKMRSAAHAGQDPLPLPADRIRDRLAVRSSWLEGHHPEALDLEAELLALLANELAGVASLLGDTPTAEHTREALRGQRHAHLALLCRLASSGRPEAGRALDAILARLAEARGYRLEPVAPAAVTVGEALAQHAVAGGEITATVTRAVADGQVTDDEAADIEERVREQEEASARLLAATARARQDGALRRIS